MFLMTFVQIAEFDWLPGPHRARIFINLLFKYHNGDEAKTLHT